MQINLYEMYTKGKSRERERESGVVVAWGWTLEQGLTVNRQKNLIEVIEIF